MEVDTTAPTAGGERCRRRVRLFVEAHAFDHGFEGSATFIAGLYRALLGIYPDKYELFVGGYHPEKAIEALGNPKHAHPIAYRHKNRFLRLTFDVPRAIRLSQADLAHFQCFTPITKSCDWIVTIHDLLFNDFPQYFPPNYRLMRNILFPLSARRADILTTVSNYSKDRISHWYGLDPNRIHIVPNGIEAVETGAFENAAAPTVGPPEGKYLLCVSRFEPRKNQLVVLEAFIRGCLWERGISLVFVGARTLPSPGLDRAISSLPSEARTKVYFLENVPASGIHALFANAEAAIYPSLAEGFGIPPLEALSFQTPSLCGNITAMSEFKFLAPFFFDPTSSTQLLDLIIPILENPERFKRIAAKASTEMMEQYSWERAAVALHQQISRRSYSRDRSQP